MSDVRESGFVRVASLAELKARGRVLVRIDGKQIALFSGEKGVFACNNRCPHEGYPLSEGSLTDGCILTCNWHNWKFDLEGGETLVGGDRLRRYAVNVRDGEVWLDLTDPSAEARAEAALDNLKECFERYDYARIARELARLQLVGADPLDGIRRALGWSHDRLEFGMTHAHAAAADWLAIREAYAEDDTSRLVPVVEVVGHLAWDTRREPAFPYPGAVLPFDPTALVHAIEAEDEAQAVGQVRGALGAGLGFEALNRPLAEAALAHYQDFGHSLIYVYKAGQLIERLGPAVAEPVLLALTRSLAYASREDLIPEFRRYGAALAAWDGRGGRQVTADDLAGRSIKRALTLTLEGSADPESLYHALLGAAAWNFLHYDASYQDRTEGPVSENIGWLDFTHAITFANAVRTQCSRFPELWPQGLLQMACFVGRNAGYLDPELDEAEWQVADPEGFLETGFRGLFDHGQFEYIVACHYVKLLAAVKEEVRAAPETPWTRTLLAACNRLLNSPIKRRHAARTAHQALAFVAAEG